MVKLGPGENQTETAKEQLRVPCHEDKHRQTHVDTLDVALQLEKHLLSLKAVDLKFVSWYAMISRAIYGLPKQHT